ncbi:hypothetical protein [Veronia pacifica]|uniref:Outer membrane protein beta-barrel domain-containing protein n=1 Tax=Veronia pacifica TaxID=1080227 RepID=A0A1C3EBI9_9GAMM|nr:hypothetical protein [Veronia pacifica]ODA30602.1 hypothetical protein A8L45_19920 [Veronia pacifica]
MKKTLITAVIAATLSPAVLADVTREGWQLSFGLGTAINSSEKIEIERDGKQDIVLDDVSFDSKPSPLYFAIKAGKWSGSTAYELEFIHNKLHANEKDVGQGIDNLEISNDVNFIYLNYAVAKNQWVARGGIGPVVASPTLIINGLKLDDGYQVKGVTGQFGLEREFMVNDSVSVGIEGKVSHSYTRLDLGDGASMDLPNTALHFLFNIKYTL